MTTTSVISRATKHIRKERWGYLIFLVIVQCLWFALDTGLIRMHVYFSLKSGA